ncbi:hypothetical protein T02_10356 [Trichinella nativa]|uniref:Uncharacterized protein n=1 Tax=Trichinella nativa TaxID=6335 RepID=A0A0V1LI55_9BILA|nr:hypothetical protein T02_10356 [Trichinella nativa]
MQHSLCVTTVGWNISEAAFQSSSVNKGVTGDETKPTTAAVRWLLSLTVHLLCTESRLRHFAVGACVGPVVVLYAGLVNVHTVCCCFPFGIVGTVHSEHKDFNYNLTKIRSLVRPRPSGPSSGLGSTLGLGGASDPPPLPPPHFQPGLARLCCLAGSSAAVVPVPPVSSNFWRQSVHACSCDRHVLCAASCGQCRACQRRLDAFAGPVWSTRQAAAVSLPHRLASLLFKFPFQKFIG